MTLSVKPEHLRRYKDIAWLLWKHGRADWVTESGLAQKVPDKFEPTEPGGPESFARDLESLGPTFIKVGQMLASRADLLPVAYIKALARLQDNVEPIPFEDVEKVINAELTARPSRAFSEIDPVPIATASLAQVHGAKLRDGRDVVIKVQRPGIQDQIRVDFEAFLAIAQVLNVTGYGKRYRFESILLEFKRAIEEELDYKLEQENLQILKKNLEKFENLYVPQPIADFSSSRMLTMERVAGTSVGSVSPVIFTEVDGQALGDELFAAYLKQVLIDGFFHADPHPGNVMLTHDHRLALIDLGMVGRVDHQLQQHLLQLLIAVSEGRGHDAAEVALRIGTQTDQFNRDAFFERIADFVQRNENFAVNEVAAGRVVLEIQEIAAETGVHLPRAMTLVGKMLLNLDSIGRIIAPGFNPNQSIRRHTLELVNRRMRERFRPSAIIQTLLETSDLIAQVPRRLNDLLTQMGKTGIRVDVDAFDEQTFIEGFQKVANRITAGLIVAALIIGAALMMRIETKFTLFGYPGLAIILFLAAAIVGIILLYEILMYDRKKPDK